MSIRLSPRSGRVGGRRDRGSSRDRHDRDNRRRRSKSPGKRSSSRSRSPKRKERRRSNKRSESPRRRRNDHNSRSPSRKDRSRRDSRSPRRKRRSRSPRRRRSPERRSGRSGRSRKDRRHRRDRGSSTSRSPVRRSRRRRDYNSSSSSSSSSETEYHHRRRRKRRDKKPKRPVVYRIGDKVEFKKNGGRRRRSRWVPAEVYEVQRGGMYGELTYSVRLSDSRRMVDFVGNDELRFRYHHDLEKRLRDDEIIRYREDLRQINLKLARQQREREFSGRGRRMDRFGGGRGRSQNAARGWQTRAHSADGNALISARPDRHQERATSVPPGNYTWPVLLAEFAKAAYCGPKGGDHEYSGDDHQFNDVDHEAAIYRDARLNHDNRIDENEHDLRVRRDLYNRLVEMNRGGDTIDDRQEFKRNGVERTPPPNDIHMGDRRGAYKMDVKDRINVHGSEINLNFVLPSCRGQQDGDI